MKSIPVLALEYISDWITANALYCLGNHKQFEIHYISRSPKSSYRFLPGIKSFHYFPPSQSDEGLLAFIEQVVHKTGARVLVPTNGFTVDFIIQHKAALQQFITPMLVPERQAFDIAADKGLSAAFMQQHHIPTPLTIFDLSGNLEAQLEAFPFPALLKPKFGAGGHSWTTGEPPITKFTTKAELLTFIKDHESMADKYIIQQFVEGYVVGCNVLYKEGRLVVYTVQKALIPMQQFAPSPGIEFIESQEAITIVDALMSRLNWSGVANLDLIYDTKTQKLQILEINPRFWLTLVGSMVGANINFPVLACQLALNGTVEPGQYQLGKYISVHSFFKYRLAARTAEKIRFSLKEIDMLYFLRTIPFKAYRFYKRKLQKGIAV